MSMRSGGECSEKLPAVWAGVAAVNVDAKPKVFQNPIKLPQFEYSIVLFGILDEITANLTAQLVSYQHTLLQQTDSLYDRLPQIPSANTCDRHLRQISPSRNFDSLPAPHGFCFASSGLYSLAIRVKRNHLICWKHLRKYFLVFAFSCC